MPYIKESQRLVLQDEINRLSGTIIGMTNADVREMAGIWNYCFTQVILNTTVKSVFPGRKYWILALVCGVFVTMLLEFYRRVVAPYEEEKIVGNGDVF